MKRISLLVYEDVVLSSVSGVIDLLNATNGYLQSIGREPAFQLELVSEHKAQVQLHAPVALLSTRTLEEATDTDLILIPAFNGPAAEVLRKNAAALDWLRTQRAKGTELASLCFGAYFLCEAGLLQGRSAACHWLAYEDISSRYPDTQILQDVVLTDTGGLYTSGGALLSWNLVLYLVEKFCGREISIGVSRMFNIDLDRHSQRHFVVFHAQHSHEDEPVKEAQLFMEENFTREISMEGLASRAAMSKRNFIRRFKAATHNTPQEYLQRVRIEAAKKALERNEDDVNGAMYLSGYNDPKTFRKVFKNITGLTPQDYRKKYRRAAVLV